jgi:hypothetical protein
MGCRTLIGVTEPGSTYTARWLHWGGHPDRLIPVLRQIWRDTFATDTAALVAALLARDWSTLDPQPRSDAFPSLVVAGIGHETRGGSSGVRRGHLADAVNADLEWLYLVAAATDIVVVYEATRHGRWLRHSRHPLDPDSAGRVIGCGGYASRGHRWTAAQVRIPGYPAVLPAEVCTMPHPAGLISIRFTDATADAIAARTAPSDASTRPAMPQLQRVGTEFDVIWPDGRPDQPQRLRRDEDGYLLLNSHLPLWHWQLPMHPTADTATEPQ